MPRKTSARPTVAPIDGARPPDAPTPTNASAAPYPTSADLLVGVALNPAQAAFLATDARFSFYVGGVGAGKTFAGALRALAYALDHPGSVGLIGAPTYPMLRDATQRTVFELLDGLRERVHDVAAAPRADGIRPDEPLADGPVGAHGVRPPSPADRVPELPRADAIRPDEPLADGPVGAHGVRPLGADILASEAAELPVKANDHALDATRYALHTALGMRARAADVWMELYLRPRRGA